MKTRKLFNTITGDERHINEDEERNYILSLNLGTVEKEIKGDRIEYKVGGELIITSVPTY